MTGDAKSDRFSRRRRAAASYCWGCALALSLLLAGPNQARANETTAAPSGGGSPAASSVAGPAPAAALPVASAVRVVQSGEVTRLVFDVSDFIETRAFVMAAPDRVIIDLPETIFAIDASAGQRVVAGKGKKAASETAPGGLIASYRFGKLGAGRSRIVIDLNRPAQLLIAATETSEAGNRLVIDLAPTDRAAFSAAAAEALRFAAPAPSQDAAAPYLADQSKPVVVIDPGHGGIDVGAIAKGRAPEKEIVFAFAKALESALAATGRYSVILTRTDDVFVPLAERVRIARNANAHLFLSIHADTLSEGGVSGATVYTVSDTASDAHAARLAEKENFADQIAGFDGTEEAGDVSDILFDLARRETRAYSHVFARTLISVWKGAARLNKNPIRSAGFRVLKAPDVPSALLELGYLSSEKDSVLLTDPEWRARTAAAVAGSIDRFFAMRAPTPGVEETAGVASIAR